MIYFLIFLGAACLGGASVYFLHRHHQNFGDSSSLDDRVVNDALQSSDSEKIKSAILRLSGLFHAARGKGDSEKSGGGKKESAKAKD